MTLRHALQAATHRLLADPHLAANAPRDAELLLLFTLDLPRTVLYTDPSRPLDDHEQQAFAATIARRLAHEPIQYITGTQEFFGLPLRVTPATLIPRPETELLVEAVLSHLPHTRPISIADIGTGSGAIAIALASRLPQARIVALDLSPAALHVAHHNARTHRVADRIHFVQSDLLAGLHTTDRNRSANTPQTLFDAIVSNPPYVPETDRATLHPQVRDHEPASALFAGPDGLDLYRRLIPQAALALAPEGLLAMEFGAGQSSALTHLLSGWRNVHLLDDLQGIPRVALALRP